MKKIIKLIKKLIKLMNHLFYYDNYNMNIIKTIYAKYNVILSYE